VFFGAEGLRAPPIADVHRARADANHRQNLAVYGIALALIVALWLFFGRTLYGKALRATAVNRLGARLVGIRTTLSGQIAFLLAAVIGAISGILIVPMTTIYYDSGFLIGLKGFVAAIIGGSQLSGDRDRGAGGRLRRSDVVVLCSDYKEVIVFTLILPVLMVRSLSAPAVEEEKD